MRRTLPGLSVGGAWTVPVMETITVVEFSYVLQLPVEQTFKVAGVDSKDEPVNVRDAAKMLQDLAEAGLTDWQESSFFAQFITGFRSIDEEGNVWLADEGTPYGRGPVEVRTTSTEGTFADDEERWKLYAELRAARRSGEAARAHRTQAVLKRST